MDVREKLVELLREVQYLGGLEEKIADHLIAHGVTVQDTSNEIKRLENQVAALKKSNRNWRRKVQRMRNRRKENDYAETLRKLCKLQKRNKPIFR